MPRVYGFSSLQRLVPNLPISSGGVCAVGNSGIIGELEALAGVALRGVYRSRSPAALENLFAVERMEVLLEWQDHPLRRMPPQAR